MKQLKRLVDDSTAAAAAASESAGRYTTLEFASGQMVVLEVEEAASAQEKIGSEQSIPKCSDDLM